MPAVAETFEALQRAAKNSRDARDACVNASHDHETHMIVTGDMVSEPVAMACWGMNGEEVCGVSGHFDRFLGLYVHDDHTIPACDFSTSTRVNPCVPKG